MSIVVASIDDESYTRAYPVLLHRRRFVNLVICRSRIIGYYTRLYARANIAKFADRDQRAARTFHEYEIATEIVKFLRILLCKSTISKKFSQIFSIE